nr:CD1871A family CXXC motif-containing protein [uncultured Oscillibacter sp.]
MKTRKKTITALRFGALGLALVLIGIGLLRQEQAEVLQKAVRICLECIGIG